MKLDSDKIEALLKKPEQKPRRKKGTDYSKEETRTYTIWFTLKTNLGVCSNPDCVDTRPMRTEDGNAMVAEIEGAAMCRYCFLDGYKVNDG